MNQKLENILDKCLDRMFNGESIETCLNAYPEQASELGPLLKTSHVIIQKSSAIQPAPEFKARVYSRLRAMSYAKQEKTERSKRIPIWHRKWLLAVASVLVVLLVGVGTVAASTSALPGKPLYPIKLTGEHIQLTLAFSNIDKAKLHIQFSERRAIEIAEMANQGKDDTIFALTEQFVSHLQQIYEIDNVDELMWDGVKTPAATSALPEEAEIFDERGNKEELRVMLSNSREESLFALGNALAKAPESTKASLQQAIEIATREYDKALYNLEKHSD
ncbi:MAG: hypothetical protein J7L19_01845 [Dehalococcoidia bacterium]|nr:hypothetical protein [Dehalococcoidia bacterium]